MVLSALICQLSIFLFFSQPKTLNIRTSVNVPSLYLLMPLEDVYVWAFEIFHSRVSSDVNAEGV